MTNHTEMFADNIGEIGGARAIGGRFDSVAIVGSATLAVTYESACALAGLDVVRSKDDAACAGILAINAGTIGRQPHREPPELPAPPGKPAQLRVRPRRRRHPHHFIEGG